MSGFVGIEVIYFSLGEKLPARMASKKMSISNSGNEIEDNSIPTYIDCLHEIGFSIKLCKTNHSQDEKFRFVSYCQKRKVKINSDMKFEHELREENKTMPFSHIVTETRLRKVAIWRTENSHLLFDVSEVLYSRDDIRALASHLIEYDSHKKKFPKKSNQKNMCSKDDSEQNDRTECINFERTECINFEKMECIKSERTECIKSERTECINFERRSMEKQPMLYKVEIGGCLLLAIFKSLYEMKKPSIHILNFMEIPTKVIRLDLNTVHEDIDVQSFIQNLICEKFSTKLVPSATSQLVIRCKFV